MRKTTLLWLVLAAICGTALFHTSQKVHDEREKLAALDASISKEEESLRVLNAEWSYLNQPARLEKLARTYLNLAPLKGSQFVKVEDIALREAVVAEATAAPEEKKETKPRIAVVTAPVPAVKIKAPSHPGLVPGPKSASARHIDSHDGQTASWMPEQVRHDSNTPRSFTDLMKNLHAGVE